MVIGSSNLLEPTMSPKFNTFFISCIGHSILPQQQKMYQDKDRSSAKEILTWLSLPVWHVVVCLWGVVEDSWVMEKAVVYIIGKGTWSLSICGGKSQAGSFLWGMKYAWWSGSTVSREMLWEHWGSKVGVTIFESSTPESIEKWLLKLPGHSRD